MNLIDRAQIVAYMLNIYVKIQEKGGLYYQEKEMRNILELFCKIITSRDITAVEETTLKFINNGEVE